MEKFIFCAVPHCYFGSTLFKKMIHLIVNTLFMFECIINDHSHKCSTSDFCIRGANLVSISFKNLWFHCLAKDFFFS